MFFFKEDSSGCEKSNKESDREEDVGRVCIRVILAAKKRVDSKRYWSYRS